MRFSTVAFTLFGAAAYASATTLVARQSPYPDCANTCIATANLGTCDVTDTICLCSSSAFVQGTTSCIQGACTGADLEKAISVSQGLCAAVGITLTSTPASTSTPTGTATTSETTSTSPVTSSSSTGSPATSSSSTGTTAAASDTATPTTTTSGAGISHPINALVALAAAAVLALAL